MQKFGGFFILYIIKKKYISSKLIYSYEHEKKMKTMYVIAIAISMLAWTTQANTQIYHNESVSSPDDYDFSHNTGVKPASHDAESGVSDMNVDAGVKPASQDAESGVSDMNVDDEVKPASDDAESGDVAVENVTDGSGEANMGASDDAPKGSTPTSGNGGGKNQVNKSMVTDTLGNLAALFFKHDTTTHNVQGDVSELGNKADDQEKRIETLEKDVETLENKVESLENKVKTLEKDRETLENKVEECDKIYLSDETLANFQRVKEMYAQKMENDAKKKEEDN